MQPPILLPPVDDPVGIVVRHVFKNRLAFVDTHQLEFDRPGIVGHDGDIENIIADLFQGQQFRHGGIAVDNFVSPPVQLQCMGNLPAFPVDLLVYLPLPLPGNPDQLGKACILSRVTHFFWRLLRGAAAQQ